MLLKKIKIAAVLLVFALTMQAQAKKYTFERPKMGSPFVITAYSDDSLRLSIAAEKAYRLVDTLNQIFSDYSPTSEMSLLCQRAKKDEWQPISAELYKVLSLSLQAAKDSDGAFDVTVGNIVKLWRKARKAKQMPNTNDLTTALGKTGWRKITVKAANGLENAQIKFDTEGVLLDFGGIVKGYAAQEVVRILTENGFPICLADAGGDLAMGENPPNMSADCAIKPCVTEGWSVGISLPQEGNRLLSQFLKLKNQAVATSGDMYNYLEIKGKRYSHIVNPKTGLGLTHQRNVTIVAPDGAQADWLATACSVLPIKKALRLAKSYRDVQILILENHKNKIKMYQSAGFSALFSSN